MRLERLVARALLLPTGVGLAAVAALVTGLWGAAEAGYGHNLAGFAAATSLSVLAAAVSGVDPSEISAFLGLIVMVALGVVLVPIALVAVIGEVLGSGSWLVYAFGMAGAFALVPILFPGDPAAHGWPEGAPVGFLATGIVAGSVYWAIAGRGAARQPSARIDDA
jgi:hypothetical protein